MKSFLLLSIFQLFICVAHAQEIVKLTDSNRVSIRGLSVVNDQLIWVSGSGGKVGKSINGGKSWEWTIIAGFEERDFRDIEAFDERTAIIIAVAEPANILKTTDGGKTWKTVFTDSSKGMFLDAMDFLSNDIYGVVVGDPIQNSIFMANTADKGDHWKLEPKDREVHVETGEAMFAASGTNIKIFRDSKTQSINTLFVTGGKKSRLFYNGKAVDLPVVHGQESTGANGLDLWDNKSGIVVGGDFAKDSSSANNCILFTLDEKIKLTIPEIPPHGYKSSVAFINAGKLVSCGTSGVDVSSDGGRHWQLISKDGYHVCRKAKTGTAVFLAGPHGKISKLVW
jgi:hypothetical protein